MFTANVTRGLRQMLMVLAVGAMLTVVGCSSFHKPKPKEAGPQQITQPTPTNEAPPSQPPEGPRPGDLKEFPAEAGVADVHFDYDKSDIRKDQLDILDKDLQYFKAHADVKIMIVGHCDERGTEEYNFALGQRRAAAVQDYLMKNGISAERLATLSKGKDAPLDPSHNEAAYAKNRRDHFLRMY